MNAMETPIVAYVTVTCAGTVAGWVCSLLPVRLVFRVVAAAVVGVCIGLVGTAVALFLEISRAATAGIGAVSVGLTGVGTLGLTLLAIAAAAALSCERLGFSSRLIRRYGPVVVGSGTALITALWLTRSLIVGGS